MAEEKMKRNREFETCIESGCDHWEELFRRTEVFSSSTHEDSRIDVEKAYRLTFIDKDNSGRTLFEGARDRCRDWEKILTRFEPLPDNLWRPPLRGFPWHAIPEPDNYPEYAVCFASFFVQCLDDTDRDFVRAARKFSREQDINFSRVKRKLESVRMKIYDEYHRDRISPYFIKRIVRESGQTQRRGRKRPAPEEVARRDMAEELWQMYKEYCDSVGIKKPTAEGYSEWARKEGIELSDGNEVMKLRDARRKDHKRNGLA
jgi:hypothetical protein